MGIFKIAFTELGYLSQFSQSIPGGISLNNELNAPDGILWLPYRLRTARLGSTIPGETQFFEVGSGPPDVKSGPVLGWFLNGVYLRLGRVFSGKQAPRPILGY